MAQESRTSSGIIRRNFMKAKSKMIRTATSFLLAMFILAEMSVAATVDVPDKTIASKRIGSMVVVLANDTGKLIPGENHFCVVFQNSSPPRAADFREVSVDFRLLVGRLQEESIAAHLSQNGPDRYCGRINLAPQYYRPASYYAFVRYTEANREKKSTRLT